jgi:prevent-host-death family protein
MIPEYSIYDTKTHLSKVLKIVKSGQEVIVTERGEPIAKLIPFPKKEETFDERIKRLESEGRIKPATKTGKFPEGVHIPGGLERFLKDRHRF